MKMCVCNKSANHPYCDGSHNKRLIENSKGTAFVQTKEPEGDK